MANYRRIPPPSPPPSRKENLLFHLLLPGVPTAPPRPPRVQLGSSSIHKPCIHPHPSMDKFILQTSFSLGQYLVVIHPSHRTVLEEPLRTVRPNVCICIPLNVSLFSASALWKLSAQNTHRCPHRSLCGQ